MNNHKICYTCVQQDIITIDSDSVDICQGCLAHHKDPSLESKASYPLPLIPCCPFANGFHSKIAPISPSNSDLTIQIGMVSPSCRYILAEDELLSIIGVAYEKRYISSIKANQLKTICGRLHQARNNRIGCRYSWYEDTINDQGVVNIIANISINCPHCASDITIPTTINQSSRHGLESSYDRNGQDISSVPRSHKKLDCDSCGISFCSRCGVYPYHYQVNCDEVISMTRYYRDFIVDGKLHYLMVRTLLMSLR